MNPIERYFQRLAQRARNNQNKYEPHDTGPRGGAAARRLRQIRDGRLKGAVVSEEARFRAHGLIHPNDAVLVQRPDPSDMLKAQR